MPPDEVGSVTPYLHRWGVVVALAGVVIAAAIGIVQINRSAGAVGPSSTALQPSEQTTSTLVPTTSTLVPTTSTADDTTVAGSGASSAEAAQRALAIAEGAESVLPADYTSSIEQGEPDSVEGEDNTMFATCLDGEEFAIDETASITAGVATLTADGPMQDSGLPGPSASIEVRVFDNASAGDEVFGVLEQIFGSDAGRQCLANSVQDSMGPMMEDAEIDLSINRLTVDGADIGSRIMMDLGLEGFEAQVAIDLLASLDGDIGTFGSFFSFGDPFPADLQADIMTATS